jgi:predicted amidophosphoribosyltransferase
VEWYLNHFLLSKPATINQIILLSNQRVTLGHNFQVSVMLCPQCQTDNPANAKFCLNCGAKLVILCPQCGVQLPALANFCFECGAKIGTVAQQPPSQTPVSPAPPVTR